jgi:hypothetical protein
MKSITLTIVSKLLGVQTDRRAFIILNSLLALSYAHSVEKPLGKQLSYELLPYRFSNEAAGVVEKFNLAYYCYESTNITYFELLISSDINLDDDKRHWTHVDWLTTYSSAA